MEKYIIFITRERNQAMEYFAKNFWKVLNKAFYGRTVEKLENEWEKNFSAKMIMEKY